METPYREAARRRARKEKALQAGEERQRRIEELRQKRLARRARLAAERRHAAAAGKTPGQRPPRRAPSAGAPSRSRRRHAARPAGTDPTARGFVDPRANADKRLCPHCRSALVHVVCLQKPVQACVQCGGVSLPGEVVQQFATQGGWFGQLKAAIALYERAPTAR